MLVPEEPTSPLDTIKDQVQIIYASGDNAQNVTQTLIQLKLECNTTWTSNKPDVIQINGSTVTLQEETQMFMLKLQQRLHLMRIQQIRILQLL